LLLAVTVFCLLAITPPATDAATGMATIDISTLGGADADNSAAATESQWSYHNTGKAMILSTAGGNYSLQGTNANLSVVINVNDVKITLNGVNITSTDIPLYVNGNTTITLAGNNFITSNYASSSKIYLENNRNLIINGTGTLTATATTNNCLMGALNNTLTIGGTATVNIISNDSSGIAMAGNGVINISAGAKLYATGSSGGNINTLHSWKIKSDGSVTFTGTNWYGLNFEGALTIEGSGKVTVIGAAGTIAINAATPNSILVGDQVTLVLKNNSAVDEIHTFEKASAANTHQWKLTNASLTSGSLTGATIDVKVATGATGTIQRVPIPATTTDVSFTATQTGGTSGTASSTGIDLTFSQAVTGLSATDITITNGTGSATKGLLTGSGTTYTVAITSVTQGNVTVAVSNFGAFNVTGGAKTVAVYAASTVYDVKNGAGGSWTKGSDTGQAITVGAPSSKVTGVSVDNVPVASGDYTVANNASGDAVVTLKASYLETLGSGSHTVKVIMNDGSASTTMNVAAAGDAEGGGGSNAVLIAVVVIAVLAIAVLAYMFVIKPKMK